MRLVATSLLLLCEALLGIPVHAQARVPDDYKDQLRLLKDEAASPTERVIAAKRMVDLRGPRVLDDFIDVAERSTLQLGPEGPTDTVILLREELANLLAEIESEGFHQDMARRVRSRFGREKNARIRAFYVRALAETPYELVDEPLADFLTDEDPIVVQLALELILERRWTPQVETIVELTTASRPKLHPNLLGLAFRVVTELTTDDAAWAADLVGLLDHGHDRVAEAAVAELARLASPELTQIFIDRLRSDAGRVRLHALEALRALRDSRSILPVLELMEREKTGRVYHRCAEVLFELTGVRASGFGATATYRRWWTDQQPEPRVISLRELARIRGRREVRQEEQQTVSEFVGIRFESKRVVFVLDVSESMERPTRPTTNGDVTGLPRRIDFAREELKRTIEQMYDKAETYHGPGNERYAHQDLWFNVITFADTTDSWLGAKEDISALARASRESVVEDVNEWIDGKLTAGGTNLYGGLERAFQDPHVDTIFLLSDGAPTAGRSTNLPEILDAVQSWNQAGRITLNVILIGGEAMLERLLRRLATDSGGTFRALN